MIDLKERILTEHHRAEPQRIESGQAGCGCSDCQALYAGIDLSRYGDRVLQQDGYVSIAEDANKQKQDRDHWTDDGQIFVSYGKRWGLTATGQRICQGPAKTTEDTLQDSPQGRSEGLEVVTQLSTPEILPPNTTADIDGGIMLHRGRPAKDPGEPVTRMTEWRRRRELARQGVMAI